MFAVQLNLIYSFVIDPVNDGIDYSHEVLLKG